MISTIACLCVLAMLIAISWWANSPTPKKTTMPVSPYRVPAEMPSQEPEIKQPKPKKEFKMDLKLGKHTKTFGYCLPICAVFVGIGLRL